MYDGFQGTGDPSQAKAQEERMQAMEEAKHSILAQALDQNARARCNFTAYEFMHSFMVVVKDCVKSKKNPLLRRHSDQIVNMFMDGNPIAYKYLFYML